MRFKNNLILATAGLIMAANLSTYAGANCTAARKGTYTKHASGCIVTSCKSVSYGINVTGHCCKNTNSNSCSYGSFTYYNVDVGNNCIGGGQSSGLIRTKC